jgi:hypothetical protein
MRPTSRGRRAKPAIGGEDPPIVTVERHNHAVRVHPESAATALTPLRTARHVPDPRRGGQLVAIPVPLVFERDDELLRPALVSLAGLEPIVWHLLLRAGHPIRVVSHRSPLGPPDLEGVRKVWTEADEALLEFVRRHERGLIRHGAGVDPVRLVAQMALAFPELTFVVVVTRDDDVRRIARRLKPYLPGTRWVTSASAPAKVGRVVLSTPWALADPAIEMRARDIVVVLDAVEILGAKPRWAVQHATRARLYGLLERDRRPAPFDADELVALFGLYEVTIPRHGHVERPVAVVTARVEGGPKLGYRLDLIELKRRGLWRHPVRNRRIARLASALATGDPVQLDAELPGLAARLAGVPVPRVAVVVEALEHALALAARLPGWPLVVGPDVVAGGLRRDERHRLAGRHQADDALPNRMIATPAGIAAMVKGTFDVVVRADGGTGLPEAFAGLAIASAAVDRLLVLFDLDDRHHPELRRWSRQRREAYAACGWIGAGTPLERAVERFLASRPEGTP